LRGAGSPVRASWATVNARRIRKWRSKQPGDCAEALELALCPGYVVHTLEAALWCIDRAAGFSEAMLLAANLADDASDEDARAADLIQEHEAKVAALEP
jgi:ADP-ribosylglycohydrolase